VRRRLGYPHWSFSAMLKKRVKQAVNHINDFEHLVARTTRQYDCSGVVCGHIHVPAIRQIDGIDYHNCGDWIEHCSALIEDLDGRITLVYADDFPTMAADVESHDAHPRSCRRLGSLREITAVDLLSRHG
jgi:UDP-2,3-diacylglucosamine pyrophosphatase LpxH